jgi:hypothetical protein
MLDEYIATHINSVLIHVLPTNLEEANQRAREDQTQLLYGFKDAIKSAHMKHIECNFNSLDVAVSYVMNHIAEYDFYFASPFFRPDQVEREERLKKHLRHLGYTVYSPKESCFLKSDADMSDRQMVFEDNCRAIRNSKAVFAVSDGKDMGTIWEAGYAFGIKKPILYYAETLGDNPFNLMLAESGVGVFKSVEELTIDTIENCKNNRRLEFEGAIE